MLKGNVSVALTGETGRRGGRRNDQHCSGQEAGRRRALRHTAGSQAVEALFRARWDRPDGLGALVMTPTRELAMQIFEELRKVGRGHALSAGLLIGGKNVKSERDVVQGVGPSSPPPPPPSPPRAARAPPHPCYS